MIDVVLERFATRAPVAVMVRAFLANVLSAKELDAIFRDTAHRQVPSDLLFSQVVGLLHLVVTKTQRSLHAAYQMKREELRVSAAALYAILAELSDAVRPGQVWVCSIPATSPSTTPFPSRAPFVR